MEDEATGTFSPLQLGVVHAMREECYGVEKTARPQGTPTRGEREVAYREQDLQGFPLDTEVDGECGDGERHVIVGYSDGDCEGLTRRELSHEIGVASQPSVDT